MGSQLQPGTVVSSRYEVRRFLGRGGMGDVYLAFDRELDETVALKLLRADLSESPDMEARFRREIKLARRVRHRNVCGIHEFGLEGALRFIAMEYVEGVDLRALLRSRGALPIDEVLDVGAQVADGLQAIHETGIVHRDLKTPNIMRDEKGIVRVMDFGIAKLVDFDTSVTATGNVVGTPEYMSPEQASGKRVDARSDIYALGVVLFELATGRVPFRADSPLATLMMHLHEPPPLDHGDAERLPASFRDVLRGCLEKSPEDRLPTAADVSRALCAVRAGGNVRETLPAFSSSRPTVTAATAFTTPVEPATVGAALPTRQTVVPSAGRTLGRRWMVRALAAGGALLGMIAVVMAAQNAERLACTAAGLALASVALAWLRRVAWPFSSRARAIGLWYGIVALAALFAFSLGSLEAARFAAGLAGALAFFGGGLTFLAEHTVHITLAADAVGRDAGLPVPSRARIAVDAMTGVVVDVREEPAEARITVVDGRGSRVVVDSTLDAVSPQDLGAWIEVVSPHLLARAEGELREGRGFRCGPIQLQRDQVFVPVTSRLGAWTLARWAGGGLVAASALGAVAGLLAGSAVLGAATFVVLWLPFAAVGMWRVRRWKVRPVRWSDVQFRLEAGLLRIDSAQGTIAVAANLVPNAFLLPRLAPALGSTRLPAASLGPS